jgi:hypothetical protein
MSMIHDGLQDTQTTAQKINQEQKLVLKFVALILLLLVGITISIGIIIVILYSFSTEKEIHEGWMVFLLALGLSSIVCSLIKIFK